MIKEYVFNRRLNEIYKYETNELLKEKIKKAKSLLNIKCPESSTTKFKKSII